MHVNAWHPLAIDFLGYERVRRGMAYPSANLPRITFRLSEELRAQLEEAALTNNRSLNAEIVARLDRSFVDASSPPMITLHESELRRLIAEYMDGKKEK